MVKFFRNLFQGAEGTADDQRSTLVVHTKAIGSTGTESYSGYAAEEYLTQLRGKERADVFDKMRRSDPQVKMCLAATTSPIKGAKWLIEPGDQNDEEMKKDAELVRWALFEGMDKDFGEWLSEALSMLAFGHSAFEIIDAVNMRHPEFGPINSIRSLAFRSQRTIERWNLNPETDKLASISQYAYGDLDKMVDIPAEFLLVLSLDKEGSNYEGISALRCCYGNWFRKNNYLKLNAIGIEKFAIPTPIVEVPNGKESGPQFDNLIAALQAYTGHEAQYLTHPEGWKVNLQTSVYDPQKVEVSIDNEDKRMVKSFMANFLELGMNGFGSQSLSFDLSDFFLGALEHIASLIETKINKEVIPRLVQMNRGPRKKYPKLIHTGLSDRAGKELAEVLEILARGKVVTPDDVLEAHVRKRFGLTDRSLVGQRQVEPAAAPLLAERMRMLRETRGGR